MLRDDNNLGIAYDDLCDFELDHLKLLKKHHIKYDRF